MNSKTMPSRTDDSGGDLVGIEALPSGTHNAGQVGQDPVTHRTRVYRWPSDQQDRLASLEVSADAAASGEMRTYRYRVSLDESTGTSRAGFFSPAW